MHRWRHTAFSARLLVLLVIATGGGPALRGGEQKKRDRMFGTHGTPEYAMFWHWWHRVEKRNAGGADLRTRQEAERAHQDWVSLGRPVGK